MLLFENDTGRRGHAKYYLPKDCNIKINGCSVFDQPVHNDLKTYENIQKIALVQEGDYTTGCLLDYLCLKENCKLIDIDPSKQH